MSDDKTKGHTALPLTVYDANDGDGLPRRPLWCIANEAYHNPPDGDDDCTGIHATLNQGFKEDADRLALAWNCHEDLVAVARMAQAIGALELGLAVAPDFDPQEMYDAATAVLARAKEQTP